MVLAGILVLHPLIDEGAPLEPGVFQARSVKAVAIRFDLVFVKESPVKLVLVISTELPLTDHVHFPRGADCSVRHGIMHPKVFLFESVFDALVTEYLVKTHTPDSPAKQHALHPGVFHDAFVCVFPEGAEGFLRRDIVHAM